MPSSAVVTNTTTKTYNPLLKGKERVEVCKENNVQAINKEIIGQTGLSNNNAITVNTGDDIHPRMTTNSLGDIIVVYEQEIDIFSRQIPVVFSSDEGDTWTMQFVFDSIDFTSGSGTLQYPDIVYNNPNDLLFLTMIDPFAEMYNNEMAFIPGDIANALEASWYGISGGDSENYNYAAGESTDNFFISLSTEDGYGFEQLFGLGYFTYPDFESPPVMGGFYYDGNSEHESAPAAELEMAKNANRIFIVCETDTGDGSKITIKSTVNDEALLTNGEMQNGMDKYADIEQYPGEYLADGTDPDVSGSGNKVSVVYVQDGNIKCSYSTCDAGTYDPGFSWQETTITTGSASSPSVYMSGDTVLCAYVQGGNLFLATSKDGGATWGSPVRKNDVDETVVGNPGSVSLYKNGIVFTDNRNGNLDLYFTTSIAGPNKPTLTGPSSGKPDKEYDFTVKATDPGGSDVWYWLDWGDGSNSGWLGPYSSGAETTVSNTWSSEAIFTIMAKAKNADGGESDWVTLKFSTPKNKAILNILERFPIINQIFRALFL